MTSLVSDIERRGMLDLVADLEYENDPDTVAVRFQNFIDVFGLSSAVFLALDAPGGFSDDCILINTRSPDWSKAYHSQGHFQYDPILAEIWCATAPFTWSDALQGRNLSDEECRVMSLAAEFGMDDGFVVPIHNRRSMAGLVSLAGTQVVLTGDERRVLTLACTYVHNRLIALRRARRNIVVLTTRELEIVRWIAAGKSDWQIGKILNISAKTVNYHVENLKRKYGVASRIQAVVAALNQGGLSH